MQDKTLLGWGFEIQRYKIAIDNDEQAMRDIAALSFVNPKAVPHGSIYSEQHGQLWVPNSRRITNENVIIALAQEDLIKIWRAIQGSVRQIQTIAVGSGLTDPVDTDTILETELGSKNIDSWDDSAIAKDSTGLSVTKAQVTWLSLEANGRLSEIGLKFDNADLVTHALFKKLGVSGATQTNPVRITTSTSHGLSTGDEVHLDNLGGMVELNDRDFTITVFDADEFDLDGEDGTGHTAYTSGGDAWLVITKTTGEVVQTNYILNFTS